MSSLKIRNEKRELLREWGKMIRSVRKKLFLTTALVLLGIILIFLLGMLFGLAFDQENSEELKKIRMRKTKAYKLGFREAREFYLKKTFRNRRSKCWRFLA